MFNPYFRISIEDCLSNSYFDQVRKPSKENARAAHVKFDFEFEGELEAPRLRELFLEEINYYTKKKRGEDVDMH